MDRIHLDIEDQSGAPRMAGSARRNGPPDPEDPALWRQFAEAKTPEAFLQSWLAIQCQKIGGASSGVVMLGAPDRGPFVPTASWPEDGLDVGHLTDAAERALHDRRGLVIRQEFRSGSGDPTAERCHVAYPIQLDGRLHGVVAIEIAGRPEVELQAVMRQLQWGAAWAEVLLRRRDTDRDSTVKERLKAVLDLFASTIEQERVYGAAVALVNELASLLACERVSVGFLRTHHIAVAAMSHAAQFEKKMDLIGAIGSAMDESYDQRAVITYPPPSSSGGPLITRAHAELARQHDNAAICTIPLYVRDSVIGALTLERPADKPFDPETVALCEAVALMAGPVLDDKRKNDRLLIHKLVESCRLQLARLTGPRHVGLKLAAGLLAAACAFAVFAKGDYRVSAKTVLEGQIQRVVAAPFSGYVAEAKARAGDIVGKGQVLAVMDDRDLRLEYFKSSSQREQLSRHYRKAMADHDRAELGVTSAQLDQANSQLELLEYQLARAHATAPFDGIVVSGDLSQSLGAPVEKGQVLFEIAPLDAYRVILRVGERDIAVVAVGQRGQLALSSLPGKTLPFTVEKITPVSTTDQGRTYFRVEARLDGVSERVRPGMEGVGKISIDRRPQIWIWTHGLIDWFRLWVWSWWP